MIELLVVIAIIGLLSTLAVVSLNNARSKARDARRVADLKAVQSALELYRGDSSTDSVPNAITNWGTSLTTPLANYLPAGAPTDPLSSQTYVYCEEVVASPTAHNYLLAATLENSNTAGGSLVGAPAYAFATDCFTQSGAAVALPACNATTGYCTGNLSR